MGVGVLEDTTQECFICKGNKEKKIFDNHRLLLQPTFFTQFIAEIT